MNIKSNSKIEIHLNNSIQSLASLIISDMNSLFSWYSSLKKLDLSNFINNSETSMNSIFSSCSNLKYLDISGFNINFYDIVNGLSNLKFINLYKAQNYDINCINNITKDLNICQCRGIF